MEHYFAYLSTADLQTKFDVESEPFLERLAGMGQSISDEAFSTLSEELRMIYQELQKGEKKIMWSENC